MSSERGSSSSHQTVGGVSPRKFRLRSVCAVSTCRSPQEMSFHRLPRDPRLRELWMKACGRKNPVTANARICGLHFRPQDFVRDLRSELMGCRHIRRLQPYAVPTINLPEVVQIEEQQLSSNNKLSVQSDVSNIHNYAGTASGGFSSGTKTLQLKTEANEASFTAVPYHTVGNRQHLVSFPVKLESENEMEEDVFNDGEESEGQLEETIIHITPETDSSPLHVGVVNIPYDKRDITKVLVLKSISVEAFNFLCNREIIHPPPEMHQNKWMKTFRTHQGIQVDALDILEERLRAYNEPKDRLCLLGIDEIPVRKGSEETVTVGIARGFFKNWKQAVYFNESKTDHEEIKILIRELEKRGLQVCALVFPPESLNTCISGFGFDSNTFFFPNPFDSDRNIYALPDPCRILKLIRQEILRREIVIYNKVLNIRDFKKVLKQCDHLTPAHLDEDQEGFALAVELISWSSSRALANAGKKKQSYLIKVLNDWFDVMNSSEERPPLYGDRLSVQSKSLANLLKLLPKVSFVTNALKLCPKSTKPISINLALIVSIQSTEALYTYIQTQYKVRSFSTGRLSLEFIEDMIGSYFIQGPQHLSVFHRFRMLQLLGPDMESVPRDHDFIPSQQVFDSLDIKVNVAPYLEKDRDTDEEEYGRTPSQGILF